MLLLTLSFMHAAAGNAGTLQVRYDSSLLSIVADEVPLAIVLGRVEKATGLKVRIDRDADRPLSLRFARLPLRSALDRVLEDVNYILVEEPGRDGSRVTVVVVLGAKDSAAAGAGAASAGRTKPPTGASQPARGSRADALQQAALEGNQALLREALSDADPTIQALALDLIAEQNRAESVPLLLAAMQSDQPAVRTRALALLAAADNADEGSILGALRSAIEDRDGAVRDLALRSLAERGGPVALDTLRRALASPDPAVRLSTVESIVRSVPARDARSLLELAARDGTESVRAVALGAMEDGARGVPPITSDMPPEPR